MNLYLACSRLGIGVALGCGKKLKLCSPLAAKLSTVSLAGEAETGSAEAQPAKTPWERAHQLAIARTSTNPDAASAKTLPPVHAIALGVVLPTG